MAIDHLERPDTPSTKRQLKKMRVTVTGRSFLSAKGIAKPAVFKLAQGTFGNADKESLRNMKNHIAEGVDLSLIPISEPTRPS